jgi:hypothetical protein
MKPTVLNFDDILVSGTTMKAFILWALLYEGKSTIGFYLYRVAFGTQKAIRHYFRKIFQGYDIHSYHNLCLLFCQYRLPSLINSDKEKNLKERIKNEENILIHFNGTSEVVTPYFENWKTDKIRYSYKIRTTRNKLCGALIEIN